MIRPPSEILDPSSSCCWWPPSTSPSSWQSTSACSWCGAVTPSARTPFWSGVACTFPWVDPATPLRPEFRIWRENYSSSSNRSPPPPSPPPPSPPRTFRYPQLHLPIRYNHKTQRTTHPTNRIIQAEPPSTAAEARRRGRNFFSPLLILPPYITSLNKQINRSLFFD